MSPRRKWALALLGLMIPVGFALGWLSVRAERRALESGQVWLAVALDALFAGFAPVATAALAVVVLRTAQERKLWLAASLLVLPVLATHYARAYHPAIIVLAEVSWFLVLVTCARAKRTTGIWCVVACAACMTGIQLESAAAKQAHSAAERAAASTP